MKTIIKTLLFPFVILICGLISFCEIVNRLINGGITYLDLKAYKFLVWFLKI